MRIYPTPTKLDLEALQAFADAHGRTWKETLSMTYWYNARIWRGGGELQGYELHSIRNTFGPTWLYDVCTIKPAKKDARR